MDFKDYFLEEVGPGKPLLKSVTATELDALEIPPRKLILAPWWGDGEQPIVWGWRGVGKSWVTLGSAAALAAGGRFLGWTAPEPVTTLFVDGEMMARRLQDRFRVLSRSCSLDPGDRLHILTPDVLGRFLNLWKEEDRQAVEDHAAALGARAVVFDNVATLYRTNSAKMVSNAAEWWEPIQTWLIAFRSRGIATLTAVHTGKDGSGPRGTSAIEDTVETSLKVAAAEGRKASDGAWFTVEFTKTRDYLGSDGGALEAKLEGDSWTVLGVDDSRLAARTAAERERDRRETDTVSKLGDEIEGILKKHGEMNVTNIRQATGGRSQYVTMALDGLAARGIAQRRFAKNRAFLWSLIPS